MGALARFPSSLQSDVLSSQVRLPKKYRKYVGNRKFARICRRKQFGIRTPISTLIHGVRPNCGPTYKRDLWESRWVVTSCRIPIGTLDLTSTTVRPPNAIAKRPAASTSASPEQEGGQLARGSQRSPDPVKPEPSCMLPHLLAGLRNGRKRDKNEGTPTPQHTQSSSSRTKTAEIRDGS
jgi:hypothetical protein